MKTPFFLVSSRPFHICKNLGKSSPKIYKKRPPGPPALGPSGVGALEVAARSSGFLRTIKILSALNEAKPLWT